MDLKVIKGKTYIVVHLIMDDRNLTYCTGEPYEHPPQNDKRPRTFCEACRIKTTKEH